MKIGQLMMKNYKVIFYRLKIIKFSKLGGYEDGESSERECETDCQ